MIKKRKNRAAVALVIMVALAGLLVVGGCGSESRPDMKLGGIDLGQMLDGLMMRTQRTLGSVQDEATARTAAKELKVINGDLDDLVFHAPKLSSEALIELKKQTTDYLVQLEQASGYVETNPGLQDILGPELTAMTGKLEDLIGAK